MWLQVIALVEMCAMSVEIAEKENGLLTARRLADATGKPLINVGCGSWMAAALLADVNLDASPQSVPRFLLGDAQDMSQFGDKEFGCLFASHVLEHLADPGMALREWERISDYQVICVPFWWSPHAWLSPEHRWVKVGDDLVRTWWA